MKALLLGAAMLASSATAFATGTPHYNLSGAVVLINYTPNPHEMFTIPYNVSFPSQNLCDAAKGEIERALPSAGSTLTIPQKSENDLRKYVFLQCLQSTGSPY